MQNFNSNQKLIYNPELRFRKEEHRCVAYTIDDFFYSPDKVSILLPQEVIMLLLFDGEHHFEEVANNMAYVFGMESNDDVDYKKVLFNSLEALEKRTNIQPLVMDIAEVEASLIKQTQDRYNDPSAFIIPKEKIIFDPRDLRLSAPLSVNYNVMTSCGFKCKYCYHPLVPVKELIPLERLNIIFKELKETGCESFMLTGGDPMLRPDIDELMQSLYEHGLLYSLSTKSIISEDRIKKLHERAGLRGMQISLDAADGTIVKNVLGITDDEYFSKAIQMIKNLQKHGIEVRVKAVLTSYNADGLADYLNLLNDLGIKRMQVVQYGRSGTRHTDDLYPSDEQMKRASEVVRKFKEAHKDVELTAGGFEKAYDEPVIVEQVTKENIFEKRAICNAGRFSLTLMPNGEVFICEQLPYDKRYVLGDLKTQSLAECWNGELMQKWLNPPGRNIFSENSPCKTCPEEYYNECHKVYSRCLRFIYEHTGDTLTADIKCPRYHFEKRRIT
ncbi:radical SAM protein [Treponema denticola]|uniref:Radical SAM additional 4Fe4S-binding domain-containing protein n=1 Tax=Treponema denticola SP33 TaxID=999437 RepID=M2BJH7_TREDN|nr:radical SAM protein [Treponema denticola]EMB21688.1 radical SAM additional 4Fe4S-binding domain-containing protein [Treponema denticola SP33]EPF35711.1 radical SAM additional 4Fe4S-binding SPASM domain-containing protein [Treponema denticola SP32]